MRKLHKVIVVVLFSLGLLLVPSRSQFKAAAQFPTIDISNLMTNIQSFLQSLDAFDLNLQEFESLMNKVEEYQKYISMFEQGVHAFTIASDIIRTAEDIATDVVYLKDCAVYFYSIGAQPWVIMAAGACFNDFKELTDDVSSDFKKFTEMLRSYRSGSEMNLLMELDNYMHEYQAKVISISYHYRSVMRNLYQQEMMYRQLLSNNRLRSMVIY